MKKIQKTASAPAVVTRKVNTAAVSREIRDAVGMPVASAASKTPVAGKVSQKKDKPKGQPAAKPEEKKAEEAKTVTIPDRRKEERRQKDEARKEEVRRQLERRQTPGTTFPKKEEGTPGKGKPAAKPEAKTEKKPAEKRFSRIDAFIESVKKGTTDFDKIVKTSNEAYAKKGGKDNEKEALNVTKQYFVPLLVSLGLAEFDGKTLKLKK